MAKLSFQQPVSEDPSEIILIWWFGDQLLLIINGAQLLIRIKLIIRILIIIQKCKWKQFLLLAIHPSIPNMWIVVYYGKQIFVNVLILMFVNI